MILLPAIDLLNGRAVRLYKGLKDNVTDYGDPVEIAASFDTPVGVESQHAHEARVGHIGGNEPFPRVRYAGVETSLYHCEFRL